MRNTAEENRKSWRFSTVMKGFYYMEGKNGEGKECSIINITPNGAGVEFYTFETVSVNSKLLLEISSPDRREPVIVEGIIQWVKQGGKDCVCGIKLTEKLDKEKMELLMERTSIEI